MTDTLPCPYCDGTGNEPGEPEQDGWFPPCRNCDGAGRLDADLFCPGCHVGPDDECEAGCPATGLERIGWTREQAADILAGRFPHSNPAGIHLVWDVSYLVDGVPKPNTLIEVLADGD